MEKFTSYKSQCIGVIIDSWTYEGEIIKTNKKSFIGKINTVTIRHGRKEPIVRNTSGEVKFTFWKTVNGKNLYKNPLYGIVEM